MGIINWFVHRSMKKEAKRLTKECLKICNENKDTLSTKDAAEILKQCTFDDESLSKIPSSSRIRINECCSTVNGFCYMMALDVGKFKGWMNLRSLQFTTHMDNELSIAGFPHQPIEHKRKILKAMQLDIDGWEKITGDR